MILSASDRREAILKLLRSKDGQTVSAGALATQFDVSRQIIVGDIALLRAGGVDIVATARGYRLEGKNDGVVRTITCRHGEDRLLEELYTIVDNGGAVMDLSVEHPVYGVLSAPLRIYSRYDADELKRRLAEKHAAPLLSLTDGVHSHTIRCPDAASYERICQSLSEMGILTEG